MNVVIAVHHFPPNYTSGAELRAYRTASRLQARGHDVHVICVEDIGTQGSDPLDFEDCVYGDVSVRRLSFDLAAAPDPFRWGYDNPWIGEHLYGYLAEIAPDVLHLISGYLMSASTIRTAKALQIPTVLTLTDFWFLCPRITLLRSNGQLCSPPFAPVTCARCLGEEQRRYRVPGRLVPGLMDLFWRRQTDRIAQVQARMSLLDETLSCVDAMISPSQFLRNLFIEAGVPPEKVLFSRQGRDFDLASKDLIKRPADHLRVGYMGQIAPHKGVHTLFDAVRMLPGVDLEVKAYGDTTRFPSYARQLARVADRDPRLKLLGVFERGEVSRVLREVDVVVVPSVWYENSPNTILEAFAHQTPVIVSDLGGMAELAQEGVNGLRFVPGDPSSLAALLQRLVDEPELRQQLRAGIQPVRSVHEEMTELVHVYRTVVERGSPDGERVDDNAT
jgi:glycosyltransferase involved in cell wall biosynthesis